MNLSRRALCVLAPLSAASAAAGAQRVPQPAPRWAVEQLVAERWLHGRQSPRFTPFGPRTTWVLMDSIVDTGASRTLYLTLGRSAYGRDSGIIVSDQRGRIASYVAALAPYRRQGVWSPDDSIRMAELRRFAGAGRLALVESRAWDVVPTLPPEAPRAGVRWVDAIRHVAADGPYRQSWTGRRVSRIDRDTVISRRRLWVVHDSAFVEYEERYPERERTLDTLVQVSRVVAGVLRGVHLLDAGLGLFRERNDSATLQGFAELRYPDGRVFRTPARYERRRTWRLHDSAGYVQRRIAIQDAQRREMGGMVRVPDSELERRLAAGDTVARDSLITEWRRATHPDRSHELYRTIALWARDATARRYLDSVRIAAGDSVLLYHTLANRAYSREPPTDTGDVRAMLPFLQDPGIAWGLNVSRDWLYENLVQGLTLWPPAATPDSLARAACTPAACAMLARQLDSREPRLRDVALVAGFATDPARWGDTVLRLAADGHRMLRSAAQLARGLVSTWSAAPELPMPSPGSDWRVWIVWMDGRDSAQLARSRELAQRYVWARDTLPRVRFEESHATAMRMYQRRTGRDLVGEIRRGYAEAASDSARLVYGTMLEGLGELRLDDAELVSAFTSGVPARIALARRQLAARLRHAPPLDSALASALVERTLGILTGTATPWRALSADSTDSPRAPRPELHGSGRGARYVAPGLSPAAREAWARRVQLQTPGNTPPLDPREPVVVYRIHPVRGFGSFAMVYVSASEQMGRAPDEAPVHYASGTTYHLMRLGTDWVLVAVEGWVT